MNQPRLRKILLSTSVMMVVSVMLSLSADAQTRYRSLWDKRDPRKAFLFQDMKARDVGDWLTIAIVEYPDVANSDSRGMGKQTYTSASGGFC